MCGGLQQEAEASPDAICEPLGTRLPQQGSVVVGTNGLIVLPHMTADTFVLPESNMAKLPQMDAPDRNRCREFIDVVIEQEEDLFGELRLRRPAERIGDHRQGPHASRARRWSSMGRP